MATTVQIQLTMDSSGAVTGVKQFGSALDDLGNRLPAVRKKGEDTFNGIESAERRAHITGNLFVRLTGVELPRAMETVISRSKVLGPLMAGAFNVAIIGTAGAAIVGVAEKITKLTEATEQHRQAWIGVNATVQDTGDRIIDELNKEKQKYIEITQGPIAGMTFAIGHMRSVAVSAFGDIAQEMKSMAEEFSSQDSFFNVNKEAGDDIKRVLADMRQAMDQAAASNPKDLFGPIVAEQKVLNSAIQETTDLIERRKKSMGNDKSLVEPLERELSFYQAIGKQLTNLIAVQTEKSKASAVERLQTEMKVGDQVISLRHQVQEEQLSGLSKIRQVEINAIDDVMQKQKEGAGLAEKQLAEEIDLIHQRADEQKRLALIDLDSQQREAQLFAQQRSASFLKGSDQIIAQAEIEKQTILNGLIAQSQKATEIGPELVSAWLNASVKLRAIDSATTSQIEINHQQLADKLTDMQQQAALAWLPEWKRGEEQIRLERNKTFQELTRLEATDGQNWALYESEKVAADQLANGRMRDEQKRLTEQFGSDIQSVFDDITSGNIGKRILANMEKFFFQIVAQWILSIGIMKSAFGQLAGIALFGPGSMGANVFGGGGSNPLSLIGSVLGLGGGSSSPQSGQIPGTFSSTAGALSSGGFNLPGLSAGSGLASATAGIGATPGNNGLFSASDALTSATFADISHEAGHSGSSAVGSSAGGGLFSAKGLAGLAPLGAMLLGSAGGKVGSIGGLITGLLLTGKLGGLIQPLTLGAGTLGTAAVSALVGALTGGLIGFGIGSSHGGVLGSLAGAGTGALAGLMVGGPIGALVGGLVGLLGGIFGGIFGGSKRKKQANSLADNTILPGVSQITQGFDAFQVDSSSAIQQLEQLRTDAEKQLKALRGEGSSVLNSRIEPAINDAEKHIRDTQGERDRRSATVFGPPQFDTGGMFSLMRGNAGLAVLHDGEFVMTPQATKKNLPTLQSMNAGGSGRGIHIAGDFVIKTDTLGPAYLKNPNGFRKDLLDALDQLNREGQI